MSNSKLQILLVAVLFVAAAFFVLEKTNNLQHIQKPNFEKASFGEKEDPMARIAFENRMLIDPATGRIPENIRYLELEYAKKLPKAEDRILAKGIKTVSLTWNQRGPVNRGGRTRVLGIDVRTNTPGNITIIAGGVSGGIWKSTDDGSTWNNKLSPSLIHSTTCIAQDTRPGFENIWYVGTGEASGNSASNNAASFRGDGIFKSTDNGDSWELLTSTKTDAPQLFTVSTPFKYVADIAVNKSTGSVFATGGNTVRKSTDGGNSWTAVRGSFTSSRQSDIEITTTGALYSIIANAFGYTDGGIWRSSNDGSSWTSITPSGISSYGRGVIAIDPNNENVVYFWVYNVNTGSTELWKYTYVSGDGDGAGGTWQNLSTKLPTAIGGPVGNLDVQGGYDMILKVQPGNSNFVIIGGTNLYRTQDAFATQIGASDWIGGYAVDNDVSQYDNHHPDQHSLVFLNSNPNILYSGHDGGLSRTNNVTASNLTWADLNNGYITTQFYSLAIDPGTANNNVIIGGLQDNGNWFTNSSTFSNPWVELPLGGDGGYTAIASGRTNYYFETQNGNVYRFVLDANGSYANVQPQPDWGIVKPNYTTDYLFINPFVLDPNDNKVMFMAVGDSVWRNSNTTTMPKFSQTPSNQNWQILVNSNMGDAVTAIGVSKTPANRLYVGSAGGKIVRMDGANLATATATDVSTGKGLPAGYVNCLAVDQSNADKVIAVFSNYSVKSIFYTSDGGTSWVDISGNLEQNADGSGNGPSVRWVNSVVVSGTTTYFAGTSTGLYSTSNLNGLNTVWSQEGSSVIGNVVCSMIQTRDSDGLVAVATHGAGIYTATQVAVGIESETSSIPSSYSIFQNYPNPFNPSTKIKFTLPSPENVKISIYDITGRKVKDLLNQNLTAGTHTVDFDATDLASGTYIYRINAGSFVQSKKMVLLK